jgi:integrase
VLGIREVARLTFREYVEERYIEDRILKRSTRENYEIRLRKHIYPLIGDVRLSALTPTRMRQVYAALARSGLSERTVRGIWLIVAGVTKQIADDGMWEGHSPSRNVRVRSDRIADVDPLDPADIPTPDECWKILDAATPRYCNLIRVAMLTGMRLQEVCGVCPDALDEAQRRVVVRRQLVDPNDGEPYWSRPKSGRTRIIERVPKEVFDLLVAQMSEFPPPRVLPAFASEFPDTAPPDGMTPIFINRYGRALQRSHFVSTYGNIVGRAGLQRGTPKARFHALRHVYVSALVDAGYKITNIMRWVGHEDANETLRTYARIFDAAPDIADERAAAFADRLARPKPRHLQVV